MQRKRTIMIYGRTRSGKTSQIAELAEHGMTTSGKKSLVYTIDAGGIGPLGPVVDLGLVDLIQSGETNPFFFLSKVSGGEVRNDSGKWVKADLSKYYMVAIESFTGFGDALMMYLAEQAALGINIGGAANVNFSVSDNGETVKIGGSNMAHYGICQTRLLTEFLKSQKLNVPIVLWTASASKEDDQNNGGKIIGPAGPGKALTAEVPRHCDLCLPIDCLPAQAGKPERHVIYLGNSVDMNAGNALRLGNTRVPMGAELPASVEPASIVKVLGLIEAAETKAKEVMQQRLSNMKMKTGN